ncbi:hypothetical protein JKP88DRAFT_277458 [Tribonema minus]|uniref:Uncharacterized protein n=1 Tax=Tribonema minus TaxID=303371 RepID=A0A835YZS7_9STRA|nr:hypothetical protein JKP88DRAFT_277458 [Tribonema minus]
METVEYAAEHGVTMFQQRSHTSHLLQPLDSKSCDCATLSVLLAVAAVAVAAEVLVPAMGGAGGRRRP